MFQFTHIQRWNISNKTYIINKIMMHTSRKNVSADAPKNGRLSALCKL